MYACGIRTYVQTTLTTYRLKRNPIKRCWKLYRMLWQGQALVGETSMEYKHFILLLLLLVGLSNTPAAPAAASAAVVATNSLYRFLNVSDFIALYLVACVGNAKSARGSGSEEEKWGKGEVLSEIRIYPVGNFSAAHKSQEFFYIDINVLYYILLIILI